MCCHGSTSALVSEPTVMIKLTILIISYKDKGFPANTTEATKTMVFKHEDEFVNMFGTLHYKLSKGNTTAYVPFLQRVDTILCYRQDPGYTCYILATGISGLERKGRQLLLRPAIEIPRLEISYWRRRLWLLKWSDSLCSFILVLREFFLFERSGHRGRQIFKALHLGSLQQHREDDSRCKKFSVWSAYHQKRRPLLHSRQNLPSGPNP